MITADEILSSEIRALSFKQPYAELMLHGKIETRTWSTRYRGLVLICASKTGYNFNQVHDISGDKQIVKITKALGRNNDHYLNNYRNGIAFAIGRLVDCRPMTAKDEDATFVEYRRMALYCLYCHIYNEVTPIELIPWKGSQGWRRLTPEQKKLIKIL